MVMFNGTKRFLGTSKSQLKLANIVKVRHFPSNYNTMSIHFLQESCKTICKNNALTCKILQDVLQDIFKNYIFFNLGFFGNNVKQTKRLFVDL